MFVIINRNKLVVEERNGTISGVTEEQKVRRCSAWLGGWPQRTMYPRQQKGEDSIWTQVQEVPPKRERAWTTEMLCACLLVLWA